MAKKTRSIVLEDIRKISFQEFDIPVTGEEDGLLKIEMCGVCSSDVAIYNGKATRIIPYLPLIMGHEILGRIEAMGSIACERHGLKVGDRVVVEYAFGCGHCAQCLRGQYVFCEQKGRYGTYMSCKTPPHLWGAYGEYLYLPPRAMIHKIREDLSPEAAVLICAVMGNAVRWLRQIGGVCIGHTVVIEGPGQQGLAGVVVARECGAAQIIVTGVTADERRFEMARLLGADYCIDVLKENPVEKVREITDGKMADLVMDVTGKPQGALTAIDILKKGGTAVLPGLYGTATQVPLLLDKVVLNEIRLQGVYSHDLNAVAPAIAIVESGRYPLEKMVTHRFGLDEAEKALRTAGSEIPEEQPIKVVLVP
jgi:alcohol dehydrogenase